MRCVPVSIKMRMNAPDICYNGFKTSKGEVDMDPQLIELGVRLTEIGAKNTASAIAGKLKAMKSSHDNAKIISEMNELIYELLDEKQELEIIARSYKDELVAQKLSEDDLTFVVDTVVPVLRETFEKMAASQNGEEKVKSLENIETLSTLEPLLSLNTLSVLQTLGFNYKKGIGEPLTELTKNAIGGKTKESQSRMNELTLEREIAYYNILMDKEAFERLMSLQN